MKRYQYRALTTKGEMVSGVIDAPGREEVLRRIEYLGLIPVEMQSDAQGFALTTSLASSQWARLFQPRPTHGDVTTFCRDLGLLLESGIRIHQALDLLTEKSMSGPLSPAVQAMRAHIGAGSSFADALAIEPTLFPQLLVSLVRIGEASGNLPQIVKSVAEERARLEALRRRTMASLRYPAFILAASAAVLVFFLFFVLPQFAGILPDLGAKGDPFLVSLINLSTFVQRNALPLSLGGGIVVVGVALTLSVRSTRDAITGKLLRLPGLRDLVRDYRTSVFCRNLGLQVANGVRLTTALDLVTRAINTGNPSHWRPAIEKLRQGARLAEALTTVDILSPVAIRMLRLGEEAGHLASVSIQAANLFEDRLERRLTGLAAIVGPAAIITIAIVVGGLVVSLMTSLISIGQLVN